MIFQSVIRQHYKKLRTGQASIRVCPLANRTCIWCWVRVVYIGLLLRLHNKAKDIYEAMLCGELSG